MDSTRHIVQIAELLSIVADEKSFEAAATSGHL
jgi:hypothetical protein